ncbi:MAG: glycosyltransferase family A protein [Candidatus Promineifilaceae bacterium]|nr:glycosyltransferase family A protein [Candidatus Promineifilaceae bacterium]
MLNGEPFIRYNLRALYPFAHEIIVVEGAVDSAAAIATKEGHSTDTTLQTLQDFKSNEDPENKLTIVSREGFWSEKDEQSQAYAKRATGDYLWQIDADEFYQPSDMQNIIDLLTSKPQITAVSFQQLSFWGGFDYLSDGFYLHEVGNHFHRLFRWGPGFTYLTHRPPTVVNEDYIDLRQINWIPGPILAHQDIWVYHYSLVFPKQVMEKCRYYDAADWVERDAMQVWANETFMGLRHPFRVHNVYDHFSWLERFKGQHPPQIVCLIEDMASGAVAVEARSRDDIEQLLRSPKYRLGRACLKAISPLRLAVIQIGRWVKRRLLGKRNGSDEDSAG